MRPFARGGTLFRNLEIPIEILLLRGNQFFDFFQVETARLYAFADHSRHQFLQGGVRRCGDAMQPAEFDDLPIQIIRLDIGFTVCDGLEG